jgi:hypothetical protein
MEARGADEEGEGAADEGKEGTANEGQGRAKIHAGWGKAGKEAAWESGRSCPRSSGECGSEAEVGEDGTAEVESEGIEVQS